MIFHAFKIALDGSGDKWGHVPGLTLEQTRDLARFPYGRQLEPDGRAYVWGHACDPRHMPSKRAMLASLPRPRVRVPSAASVILAKLERSKR